MMLKARGIALRCCSETGGAVKTACRLYGVSSRRSRRIRSQLPMFIHGGLGGVCRIRGYEPEVTMELLKVSKTKARKFTKEVREYAARLGMSDPGPRYTARQHICRICLHHPAIRAKVRPHGGRLTEEQVAAFFKVMIDQPLGPPLISPERFEPAPPSPNPKIERRKLTKAQRKASDERQKFYDSWDWKKARYEVLKKHGPRCMVCNATRSDLDLEGKPVRIVVDHIRPIYKFWELRLEPTNLQVLCYDCNKGKGAWDETDWRT